MYYMNVVVLQSAVEMDGARVAAVANGQTVDLKRVGSTRPGK
jgi:hypothetical protein